jgi:hypothetical protein
MIQARYLLLLVSLLGACDGFAEVADQGITDATSPDAAPRDRAVQPDSPRDRGAGDQVLMDQVLMDQAQPDQLQPDQLQPDALSSPSIGQICTDFGKLCPDGKTYCIAFPFDTRGYCSKLCLSTGDICTGMPPGTIALCNMQAQAPGGGPALLCGFKCKHAGKSYSCPPWPYGSTCDGSDMCHPK